MASTLLLVPTSFERDCFSQHFLAQIQLADIAIELCGFGPIVSAIRTTQLIALYGPNRVVLTGVAGALDSRCEVGMAVEFDEVICFGVGAGSGDAFMSASEMGWRQWPNAPEISDAISLHAGLKPASPRKALLTCCSASANEQDVRTRRTKHANAFAEDMEGFSVAAACRFSGIPLTIVRGISNLAGDRNKANWRVSEAMAAVEKSILEDLV